MSYQQGDAQVGPICPTNTGEDRDCNCEETVHKVRLSGLVYLPHSCEEWIVGSKEEVEMLIADLQELIKVKR